MATYQEYIHYYNRLDVRNFYKPSNIALHPNPSLQIYTLSILALGSKLLFIHPSLQY
jgi:hypothetical protein